MSKEKSEKYVRNVPITVRLNEEEHEKLKQCAAACGLSAAEFMRQLCKGNAPQGHLPGNTEYRQRRTGNTHHKSALHIYGRHTPNPDLRERPPVCPSG